MSQKWVSAEDRAFHAVQDALAEIGCFLSDEALDDIGRLVASAVGHPQSRVALSDGAEIGDVGIAEVLCDSGSEARDRMVDGEAATLDGVCEIAGDMLDGAYLTHVVVVRGDDDRFYVGEFAFDFREVDEEDARRVARDFGAPRTGFAVWNDTDGVKAVSKPFTTREGAEAFVAEFRARFVRQGYYFTSRGERIPPEAVELRIKEVKDPRRGPSDSGVGR